MKVNNNSNGIGFVGAIVEQIQTMELCTQR